MHGKQALYRKEAVLNDGFIFENGDTVADLNGGEYGFVIKNNV